tara:strand:- start:4138 stop:4275 length:138 start_codon:yes stop_codon:yes gene_type:complete
MVLQIKLFAIPISKKLLAKSLKYVPYLSILNEIILEDRIPLGLHY